MQEIEATQSQILRTTQELEHAREQAKEEALQLKTTAQFLQEAVEQLDLTLAGNNQGSSLLCLNDVGAFKAVDQTLLSEMTSYWTAQISSAPTCNQLLEVKEKENSLLTDAIE